MCIHKKKIVDVYVTSAFSKNGEGGNKAGVVSGRLGLEPSQKMESGVTAICRNFAPLYGIYEEPATGTASCALVCYLFKYHRQQPQYIFEQGHNMGAISRIAVNLSYHGNVIDSVFVGGYGYLLGKKSFLV